MTKDKTMSETALGMKTALEALGWTPYHDRMTSASYSLYKRFDTPTRCECNNDKAGMQITAHCHDMSQFDGMPDSYTFKLCGELPCGRWFKSETYADRRPIIEGVEDVGLLLEVWECAANKINES